MQKTLIVIVGPTAVGKTQLSIDLALHLNTEIISADSRQFYSEMTIGTAKPSLNELSQVPHHFINNGSVKDYYSAGDFEREALHKIETLFTSGLNQLIAVGGSGLYIKALCEGLDEMPAANLAFRNQLILDYNTNGIEWLQNELRTKDAYRFETIDQQNPQRMMRALELLFQGGIRKVEKKARPFRIVKIGLERPRTLLYDRINQRVDIMMKEGLLEEAKNLHHLKEFNALQTVGYQEFFDFFEGKTTLERAIELVKQHSRNYAKRQLTWFKADPEINWFNFENQVDIQKIIAADL